MEQEEIIEELTSKQAFNFYYVDKVNGNVYERNDMFEAGMGTLYELIGSLDLSIIEEYAVRMDPDRVGFIDDENRTETLRDILSGWVHCEIKSGID